LAELAFLAGAATSFSAASRGLVGSVRRAAGRDPLPARRVERASSASSIAPAKSSRLAGVGDGGRGGVLTPAAAGNGRIVPLTTVDYRFRFSVSIRTSSETVIVFELAW
jgi:hypothetical protein